MLWPSSKDYYEAIQDPQTCFFDPELKNGRLVTDEEELPRVASGQFVSVYQVQTRANRWAVRCFLNPVTDQWERYAEASQYLTGMWLPPLVGFEYQVRGIQVQGKTYPIVKMEWVEGETLPAYLERHLSDPKRIGALAGQWRGLINTLRDNHLAHGDLQHGNIFITPQGQIKLVDYDSLFVPSMRGKTSPELGHPNYQHPRRSFINYDNRVDNFSALVIYISLLALAAEPALWSEFHTDDNLLLSAPDFIAPTQSVVFARLYSSPDPVVPALAATLARACMGGIAQTPDIETAIMKLSSSTRPLPSPPTEPLQTRPPMPVASNPPPITRPRISEMPAALAPEPPQPQAAIVPQAIVPQPEPPPVAVPPQMLPPVQAQIPLPEPPAPVPPVQLQKAVPQTPIRQKQLPPENPVQLLVEQQPPIVETAPLPPSEPKSPASAKPVDLVSEQTQPGIPETASDLPSPLVTLGSAKRVLPVTAPRTPVISRRSLLLTLGGGVLGLSGIGLVWSVAHSRKLPDPAPAPAPAPSKIVPHEEVRTNSNDGSVMLFIPAGDFLMGDEDQSENPRRTVYLDRYWIYKNPVTVAQYRKFCTAMNHKMPEAPEWGWKDDHPIVNVSWEDAKSYCEWAGMYLPSEAQWEKAARGTDGKKYPWGSEWDAGKCANSVGPNTLHSTVPAGSYPQNASPCGALDMAGNVMQWCDDWYEKNYLKTAPNRNPTGPTSSPEGQCVVRGGSWRTNSKDGFRTSNRTGIQTDSRVNTIGFRCATGV